MTVIARHLSSSIIIPPRSSGSYNLLVLITLDSTGIMDTEIKVLVLQGGFMTP